MTTIDLSDPTHQTVDDSDQEPLPGSRLLRRHRRLRILFWLLVAAALLVGFAIGAAVGQAKSRDMVQLDRAAVPPGCQEAIRQADTVTRKGFATTRDARQYLTTLDQYAAGRLDGHETLQRTAGLGGRARTDSEEFLAALPAWRIARSHCQPR